MLSTNSPGRKSEYSKQGEEFDISGIILKPHDAADVVIETMRPGTLAKLGLNTGPFHTV